MKTQEKLNAETIQQEAMALRLDAAIADCHEAFNTLRQRLN